LWEHFKRTIYDPEMKAVDVDVDAVADKAGHIRHDIANLKVRVDVLRMLVERMRDGNKDDKLQ
jgi:hypothetical protein